jgi:hypothetical protein
MLLGVVALNLTSNPDTRPAKKKKLSVMEEIERRLNSNEYKVLDVKCFCSTVPGGEYQLVAVLKATDCADQYIWNQHCHLDEEYLIQGSWRVSTELTSRPVEVTVFCEVDRRYLTYQKVDLTLDVDTNGVNVDNAEECTVDETIRTDGAVLVANCPSVVTENKRSTSKSEFKFKREPGSQFITKVRAFLDSNAAEYLKSNSEKDLVTKASWNMVISVLGMTRTRARFVKLEDA